MLRQPVPADAFPRRMSKTRRVQRDLLDAHLFCRPSSFLSLPSSPSGRLPAEIAQGGWWHNDEHRRLQWENAEDEIGECGAHACLPACCQPTSRPGSRPASRRAGVSSRHKQQLSTLLLPTSPPRAALTSALQAAA